MFKSFHHYKSYTITPRKEILTFVYVLQYKKTSFGWLVHKITSYNRLQTYMTDQFVSRRTCKINYYHSATCQHVLKYQTNLFKWLISTLYRLLHSFVIRRINYGLRRPYVVWNDFRLDNYMTFRPDIRGMTTYLHFPSL